MWRTCIKAWKLYSKRVSTFYVIRCIMNYCIISLWIHFSSDHFLLFCFVLFCFLEKLQGNPYFRQSNRCPHRWTRSICQCSFQKFNHWSKCQFRWNLFALKPILRWQPYGSVFRMPPVSLPMRKGQTQTINFLLKASKVELKEAVIYAGENPANIIIKKVAVNRDHNNYDKLSSYSLKRIIK